MDAVVEGECEEVFQSSAGHVYLTLRNESGRARVSCVAWGSWGVSPPARGVRVRARVGWLGLYAPKGAFQVYVSSVTPCTTSPPVDDRCVRTLGALARDGLLERTRRSLPALVRHLGVVTSLGSAAHADVMHGVHERWPGLRVTLFHSAVQGVDAPKQLRAALHAATTYRLDALIVARGGGARVDLCAFDDEAVCRALCDIALPPVVVGVGHENDSTAADQAADVRAKTPSAAVELVLRVPRKERERELAEARRRARSAVHEALVAGLETLRSRVRYELRSVLARMRDGLARLAEEARAALLVARPSPKRVRDVVLLDASGAPVRVGSAVGVGDALRALLEDGSELELLVRGVTGV